MSAETELLPCPFCGGRTVSVSDAWVDRYMTAAKFEVYCDDCGGTTDDYMTRDDAVCAWNRRLEATAGSAAVRVKALEWDEDTCGNWHSSHAFGNEFVQKWTYNSGSGVIFDWDGTQYTSIEDAKAAAQSHFEAAIRSSLEVETGSKHSEKLKSRLENVARSLSSRPPELRGPFNSSATEDSSAEAALSQAHAGSQPVAETRSSLINVNDKFAIKLTDEGERMLALGATIIGMPGSGEEYAKACHKPREDGKREFQLHEIMRFFGSAMFLGNSELPFETEMKYLATPPSTAEMAAEIERLREKIKQILKKADQGMAHGLTADATCEDIRDLARAALRSEKGA